MLIRWETKPKIIVDESQDNKRDASPIRSPSPAALRLRDPPEPLSPAPREILHPKNKDEKFISREKLVASKEKLTASKEKLTKEDKLKDKKDDKLKDKKDDKHSPRSPNEEKYVKKDKKKDKENKFNTNNENHLSSERIIIGGEDAVKNAANSKSRLPHEVLNQFEGKSREVNISQCIKIFF